MRKLLLVICLVITSADFAVADTVTISHFVVKENPFAKDEIAVVATDTANNILQNVNGIFTFTMNGFEEISPVGVLPAGCCLNSAISCSFTPNTTSESMYRVSFLNK